MSRRGVTSPTPVVGVEPRPSLLRYTAALDRSVGDDELSHSASVPGPRSAKVVPSCGCRAAQNANRSVNNGWQRRLHC
jgi:hypothetical protein